MTSEIVDFSHGAEPIVFTADGDTFTAYPAIAGKLLIQYTENHNRMVSGNVDGHDLRLDAARLFFELALTPESAAQMDKRLGDAEHPITLDQIDRIATHLLERYGMRPLEPSALSSRTEELPDAGSSSVESAPHAGSTSEA